MSDRELVERLRSVLDDVIESVPDRAVIALAASRLEILGKALQGLTDEAWAAVPYLEGIEWGKPRGTIDGLNRAILAARSALGDGE